MSSGARWAVTSIERTAYPRFKRLITAHELHLFFSPSRDEVEWAAARAGCDEHLPAQPPPAPDAGGRLRARGRHLLHAAAAALRAGSRKNATYTAFREVGRVIRTVQLPADGEELGDGVLAGGVLLDEVGPASPAGLAACSCNNYRYD